MTVELNVMIEGQQGLSWPRWKRIAAATEELGFDGLYRSDHFVDPSGPYQEALELWASFAWLAGNTSRIAFGPLVSPVSFRDPVVTAWQAGSIDALASGRLRLGVGAGWNAREHESFGYELLEIVPRFARFEEGLKVITRLLGSADPVSFEGEWYTLKDALINPRGPRDGGPPITIGGNGPRRTLPLVARYADEWNATSMSLDDYRARTETLDELIQREGRKPEDVRRTVMRGAAIGRTDAEVVAKLNGGDREALLARGAIVGTVSEAVDQVGRLAEAGVQGIMLQWLDMDDISGLELVAAEVLPQVRAARA